MKKSTKKYLLYGVGAYVLLTSGVIGATKVQSRIRQSDAATRAAEDLSVAEIRALQAELAQAQDLYEEEKKLRIALGQAYVAAEEFIVKKDLSLNMWNQYLNKYGGPVRNNPLTTNYAVYGPAWADPPELPPHSATASN